MLSPVAAISAFNPSTFKKGSDADFSAATNERKRTRLFNDGLSVHTRVSGCFKEQQRIGFIVILIDKNGSYMLIVAISRSIRCELHPSDSRIHLYSYCAILAAKSPSLNLLSHLPTVRSIYLVRCKEYHFLQ